MQTSKSSTYGSVATALTIIPSSTDIVIYVGGVKGTLNVCGVVTDSLMSRNRALEAGCFDTSDFKRSATEFCELGCFSYIEIPDGVVVSVYMSRDEDRRLFHKSVSRITEAASICRHNAGRQVLNGPLKKYFHGKQPCGVRVGINRKAYLCENEQVKKFLSLFFHGRNLTTLGIIAIGIFMVAFVANVYTPPSVGGTKPMQTTPDLNMKPTTMPSQVRKPSTISATSPSKLSIP